jgi:hypothetical protein
VRQQVRPGKHFVVRCGLDGQISEGEVFRLVFVRGAVVCLMECWWLLLLMLLTDYVLDYLDGIC